MKINMYKYYSYDIMTKKKKEMMETMKVVM